MTAATLLSPTEGRVRPVGGREAPALGGGSGAARFASEPAVENFEGVAL